MRVLIDENQLEADAANWWRNLSPVRRGVLVQALWECGHGNDDTVDDIIARTRITPPTPVDDDDPEWLNIEDDNSERQIAWYGGADPYWGAA